MQLIVNIKLNHPLILPINYNHILQAVIYNAVGIMPEYSAFLHEYGFSRGQRSYKMFQFSPLKGEYKIQNKRITFLSDISFEVRSLEPVFIRLLGAGFLENGIRFGENTYRDIELEAFDYTIESETMLIQMKSPLTVYATNLETNYVQYFSPDEAEFYEAVNSNFYRKYQAYYGVEPKSLIELDVYDEEDLKKMVTSYKGSYISGWYGSFVLRGKRKYLDFLYQAGLGGKNAQGFGMFTIL